MKDRAEHLTEGWPDEPGNGALAAFARELDASVPELSPAAMKRIEARMRRRMWRGVWMMRAVGLAAALALAAGGYAVLRMREARPGPVRDVYTVTPAPAPVGETPRRPLVAVEEYAGLIGR